MKRTTEPPTRNDATASGTRTALPIALATFAGLLIAVAGAAVQAAEDATEPAHGDVAHALQHQALVGLLGALLVGTLLGAAQGAPRILLLAGVAAVAWAVGAAALVAIVA